MPVYMSIENIKGDCLAEGYKDWIICESCSLPTTRPDVQTTTGKVTDRTRSQVDFEDVSVKKTMDLASPFLFSWNVKGDGRTVKIHFTKEGGKAYLKLVLKDCILTKMDVECDEEGAATENLSLDFTAIEYLYQAYDAKQKALGDPKVITFDVSTGKAG